MTRYRIYQSANDGFYYTKKRVLFVFWQKVGPSFSSFDDIQSYVKSELGIKGWRSRPWFDEFVMEIGA